MSIANPQNKARRKGKRSCRACIPQKHREFLTGQNLHCFLDRVRVELERSKEVEPHFLNSQPSLSELELVLRFIFFMKHYAN